MLVTSTGELGLRLGLLFRLGLWLWSGLSEKCREVKSRTPLKIELKILLAPLGGNLYNIG